MALRRRGVAATAAALAAARAATGAPADLLSWDEAYARANETLSRMTAPLLHISGLCEGDFANGLLLQEEPDQHNGAAVYGAAGYYLFRQLGCGGGGRDAARWVFGAQSLYAAGCAAEVYVDVPSDSGPPLGTHSWRVRCKKGQQTAAVTLTEMQGGEKMTLLKGVGWEMGQWWYEVRKWWYTGNTVPIRRLGVPSLKFHDSGGGFRTTWSDIVGTATAFPSMLAMAATWDEDVVREYAAAVAWEYKGKGANGVLGPVADLIRTPFAGRSFECISGEDPYLGSRLIGAYVEGVQIRGVFAVVKHWVFNQQETERGTSSSVVDDQTAWELYYPPFQAAVDAGVSGVMCSYNKIDGVHSCSNEESFKVLRDGLKFRGFTQTDWWGSHSVGLSEGLDQEMPGAGSGVPYHPEFRAAPSLATEPAELLDASARRVLAVMHRSRLMEEPGCSPPYCEAEFRLNVTTPEHLELARRSATRSIVLLKNDAAVLPLAAESAPTIAVVGAAAVAASFDTVGQNQGTGTWNSGDYYSGGGSGHMASFNVITPLAGLKRRAESAGIRVHASPTDNTAAAAQAASRADVTFVVVGTTSGEALDRETLRLDGEADALVAAVAAAAKRTIVLVHAPGAVVMPWRDEVDGILVMFLGGQETGNSWADVVFGDTAPSGRLPLAMPAVEWTEIRPGAGLVIDYSEGMRTSYRNTAVQPAYPFGHGLTYAVFEYGEPAVVDCAEEPRCGQPLASSGPCKVCLRIAVHNAGGATSGARAVPQLYLELPKAAGHPAPMLKGFRSTAVLAPGASEDITFALRERDVSYYSVAAQGWTKAEGIATAHIGESSADIRRSLTLCLGAAPPCDGAGAVGVGGGGGDRRLDGNDFSASFVVLPGAVVPLAPRVPLASGQQVRASHLGSAPDVRHARAPADHTPSSESPLAIAAAASLASFFVSVGAAMAAMSSPLLRRLRQPRSDSTADGHRSVWLSRLVGDPEAGMHSAEMRSELPRT